MTSNTRNAISMSDSSPPRSPEQVWGDKHEPLSRRGKARRWTWQVFALWAVPALIVAGGILQKQGDSGAATPLLQGQHAHSSAKGTRALHLVGTSVPIQQEKQALLLRLQESDKGLATEQVDRQWGEGAGTQSEPVEAQADPNSPAPVSPTDKDSPVSLLSKMCSRAIEEQAQQAANAPWYKDVPFDVVVGWYNQTDPERKALRKKYNPNDTFTYGTEPNMGEIYLSLASIQHFMPWVNKIFLVVPGHHPRLDMFAPPLRNKIRIVNESEFIPAEYLPTFNSAVIEAFLHRIPGISDYFMYTMDDVFLGRLVPKSSVFSKKPGVGAVHLMNWHYIAEPVPAGELWRWPFYNTGLVLKGKFGELPRLGWHAGYILTKSSYKVAWALYEKELKQSVTGKFRVYKSLNQGGYIVMHLLAEHIALHLGLQELVLAQHMSPERVRKGDYPPVDVPTFSNSESHNLKGMPPGLLMEEGGDPSKAVTYINFNKLQNAAWGGVRNICASIMKVVGDAFEERYRQCMCGKDEIGKACLGI